MATALRAPILGFPLAVASQLLGARFSSVHRRTSTKERAMKNKRSAVLTAGGLAASFMAGAAAVTFHWGMGTSAASTVSAEPGRAESPKPLKPIVKHRTIVIRRKARAVSFDGAVGGPGGAHRRGPRAATDEHDHDEVGD